MTSIAIKSLFAAIFGLLMAAQGLLPAPAEAAKKRTSPSARAMVEERGQKARVVVHLRHLPVRGKTRVAYVSMRVAKRTLRLKRNSGNRWTSTWRPAAGTTSLRGKRASVKVKRKAIKRSIYLKVKIANGGGHHVPTGPDPPPDPPNPPAPPDPPQNAPTAITASGLVPLWTEEPSDFTISCEAPVEFSVLTGDPVSIDGRTPRTGGFSESVALLPGQSTKIETGGETQTVRCRPEDLPLPTVEGQGKGLYLIAPTLEFGEIESDYAMVLNGDGVPIWWFDEPGGTLVDFKLVDEGTFAWTRAGTYGFVNGPNQYDLGNFDGSSAGSVGLVDLEVGADNHDLQPTADGGWLLIAYLPRDCPETPSDCEDLSPWGGPSEANVIDAVVQKVDAGNELVWQWSSRDHIGLEESADWISWLGSGTALPGGTSFDTVHMNSVEPSGDGFVFSARHLNAVYRVGDAGGSGEIDWKLGGTPTPESLTVTGDPQATRMFGGQHDARVLADGTLTVYDNGTRRDRPPRLVRYAISDGNAGLLESLADPQMADSTCCGSARRLPDGNWLAAWGAKDQVVEYTPDGITAFRLIWPGGLSTYRATREGPDRLDPADLRAGMEAQYPRQAQPGG